MSVWSSIPVFSAVSFACCISAYETLNGTSESRSLTTSIPCLRRAPTCTASCVRTTSCPADLKKPSGPSTTVCLSRCVTATKTWSLFFFGLRHVHAVYQALPLQAASDRQRVLHGLQGSVPVSAPRPTDYDGYVATEYEGNRFTPGHPMAEKEQVAAQLSYTSINVVGFRAKEEDKDV